MKRILFIATAFLFIIACGGTPTPSSSEIYFATLEAENIVREEYFNCTIDIDNKMEILQKDADTCANDYECREVNAQKIENLINELTTMCTPIPKDMSSKFGCKVRLMQAQASYVRGAPNETGDNQRLAEEYLANEVKEAYELCFSLYSQ